MKYEIGKPYTGTVESSKPIKAFDYPIPTPAENQKYLNLLFSKALGDFEKERRIKVLKRAVKYENN